MFAASIERDQWHEIAKTTLIYIDQIIRFGNTLSKQKLPFADGF